MPSKPPIPPPARPLNLRQQRFVQEYLVDGVASAAARRAGYSGKSAVSAGHQLMRRPGVLAAIEAERARRARPLTREEAAARLRAIAEASVLDYARPGKDGALELDLWRLERDRGAAVKALSVVEKTDPASGVVTRTVGFTLADRSAALIKLLPMLQAAEAGERAADEAAAERRGWTAGAEAVAGLPPDVFGRFVVLRAAMSGRGRPAAIETVLKILEAEEAGRRMTAGQARIDAALKARQAELDALADDLDAEREALDEDRARILRDGQRLERRLSELARAESGG